jgi:hypothetical protein
LNSRNLKKKFIYIDNSKKIKNLKKKLIKNLSF